MEHHPSDAVPFARSARGCQYRLPIGAMISIGLNRPPNPNVADMNQPPENTQPAKPNKFGVPLAAGAPISIGLNRPPNPNVANMNHPPENT
jgi:hypothetical protein